MTIRSFGIVGGALLALAVVFAPLAARAAEEDVRGLLQALWIQTPTRELIAPSFALPASKESPVRLSEHRGRTVMIYFWTTY